MIMTMMMMMMILVCVIGNEDVFTDKESNFTYTCQNRFTHCPSFSVNNISKNFFLMQ